MNTLEHYKELRKDLSYPAKWAIHYAREYQEIEELESKYEIIIEVEEEYIPIKGNVIDSGDSDFDELVEDEILERLGLGDIWAWAYVSVTVKHAGFEATDHLGGCSYKDEADFKRGGYYYDMIKTCLNEIETKIYENQSGEH